MADPVVWFEIIGSDGEALRRYYTDLFGWEYEMPSAGMDYGMVAADEGGIGGGVGSAPDGTVRLTFYVQVDDVAAALERAESLGGRKVMGPMQVPDGPEIAQFEDPQGLVVGLVKPQPM